MIMENILKSKTLNATLKQKGYVIIPFLNSTEVTSLKEAYQKSHPNNPDGFYATTHANDVNFRKHANEQIKAVLNAWPVPGHHDREIESQDTAQK